VAGLRGRPVRADPRGDRRRDADRCYSPACSQLRNDGRIELTIKAHPEGCVAVPARQRGPGLVVGLSQADGTFRLPFARPSKVLLVSGGSGITPVMSMLRTLCDEGYGGHVTFLHYAYTENDVPYRAELTEIAATHANVRVVLAYTDQSPVATCTGSSPGPPRRRGAVARRGRTFLCGPPGLMRSVRELFGHNRPQHGCTPRIFAPLR